MQLQFVSTAPSSSLQGFCLGACVSLLSSRKQKKAKRVDGYLLLHNKKPLKRRLITTFLVHDDLKWAFHCTLGLQQTI